MRIQAVIAGAALALAIGAIAAIPRPAEQQPMTADTYSPVSAETARVEPETGKPIQTTTQTETRHTEPQDAPVYYWEGNDPGFHGYPEPPYSDLEIKMLAQTVWGEASGCLPDEQRLVAWTVFQRVDSGTWGDTIEAVLTAKGQFVGYDDDHPIDLDIYALCAAEAAEWAHGAEPPTLEPYALTTPYLFFDGDGLHNWFREEYR